MQEVSNSKTTKQENDYSSMPNGAYTGFKILPEIGKGAGIIALLGYPFSPSQKHIAKYKSHDLIYLNELGEPILLSQKEVLDYLAKHKDYERDNDGLRLIDSNGAETIQKYSTTLGHWLKSRIVEEEVQEDGTVKQTMGKGALDLLNKLKSGSKIVLDSLK